MPFHAFLVMAPSRVEKLIKENTHAPHVHIKDLKLSPSSFLSILQRQLSFSILFVLSLFRLATRNLSVSRFGPSLRCEGTATASYSQIQSLFSF